MLETGINIIEWPSLQYCTMGAFGGDALPGTKKGNVAQVEFYNIDDEKRIKFKTMPTYNTICTEPKQMTSIDKIQFVKECSSFRVKL